MSKQVLNEQTFSTANVQAFAKAETAGRMTYGGVIARSLFFLVLTVAFAVVGWNAAADVVVSSGLWFFLGYMLLIGISIAAASNPRLAIVAGILYAVLMGTWMGSISRIYEAYYDGIVGQAIIATLATFLGALFLYASRAVRVTSKFVRVVVVAMSGLLLMYVFGWFMSLFGIDLLFWTKPNTVGIVVSVLICLLAAACLMIDFAVIETGVEGGAPADIGWYAAFGLLTTLVWLYLEILRLLAILRRAQG